MKTDPREYITGSVFIVQENGPVLFTYVDGDGRDLETIAANAPITINFKRVNINAIKVSSARSGKIYSYITHTGYIEPDDDHLPVIEYNESPPISPYFDYSDGKVVCEDKFDKYSSAIGEKWKVTGGTCTLETDYNYEGTHCAKLLTGATGGNNAHIVKYFSPPLSDRFRAEFWWATASLTAAVANLEFRYQRYDGAERKRWYLFYEGNSANICKYWSSDGAWVALPGGSQDLFDGNIETWHHLKFEGDYKSEVYGQFASDNLFLNMSDIAIRTDADTSTVPHFEVRALITTQASAAINLRIGKFRLMEHV